MYLFVQILLFVSANPINGIAAFIGAYFMHFLAVKVTFMLATNQYNTISITVFQTKL